MRIHHVISSVLAKYGGPSYSVPALCNALAEAGHDVTLHVYEPIGEERHTSYATRAYHLSSLLPTLGLSRNMPAGLMAAARDGDIMHVHGQWMLCDVWPARAVRGTGCRLVTSPRGMLDGWALRQSALRKRAMWLLCQRGAVLATDLLHATALTEAKGVWKLGVDAPTTIVPNGVDTPTADQLAHFAGTPRTLLFLGRLHPKKGIDRLLRAWSRIQSEFPDWRLLVVGPDNTGYRPELQELATTLQARRVTFSDAVYGVAKQRLFQDAQLFILPTHSENFGISVAEALAYGLPAIVSRGAPWSGLDRERCGSWIDNDVPALASALEKMMAMQPAELRVMGERGRAWIVRDFSWKKCARMMAASYQWVREGGERPEWILDPDSVPLATRDGRRH